MKKKRYINLSVANIANILWLEYDSQKVREIEREPLVKNVRSKSEHIRKGFPLLEL